MLVLEITDSRSKTQVWLVVMYTGETGLDGTLVLLLCGEKAIAQNKFRRNSCLDSQK